MDADSWNETIAMKYDPYLFLCAIDQIIRTKKKKHSLNLSKINIYIYYVYITVNFNLLKINFLASLSLCLFKLLYRFLIKEKNLVSNVVHKYIFARNSMNYRSRSFTIAKKSFRYNDFL